MTEQYYKVLGVNPDATFQEIKSAYRIKAKELHPDLNKSPNAHDEFILLNEAYEYLLNKKTGKIFYKDNTRTKPYSTYEQWNDNEGERARRRAEYYASQSHQDFINSEYYKVITSLNVILGHLGFFFAIAVLVVMPLILTVLHGWSGFGISLLGILITLPVTVDAIKSAPTISFKELWSSIMVASKTRNFIIALCTLINFIAILKVGFQTLVPFYLLLAIFIGVIGLTFAITKLLWGLKTFQVVLTSFCLIPLGINLLFVINFLFSSDPIRETYSFKKELQRSDRGWEETTSIILNNNKYDEYYGIRVFGDLDAMQRHNQITYTFKKGLLGVRVMTNYYFD